MNNLIDVITHYDYIIIIHTFPKNPIPLNLGNRYRHLDRGFILKGLSTYLN